MYAKLLKSCLTPSDTMDRNPPGSSFHGILQREILEYVAMLSSRGSFPPRDQIRIFYVSCIGRQIFTTSTTWEAPVRCVKVDSHSVSTCENILVFRTFILKYYQTKGRYVCNSSPMVQKIYIYINLGGKVVGRWNGSDNINLGEGYMGVLYAIQNNKTKLHPSPLSSDAACIIITVSICNYLYYSIFYKPTLQQF